MSIPAPGSEQFIADVTDSDEIVLANIPLKAKQVNFDLINIANRKTQIGDPGPDDHPVNSTITVRSNIGGGQVLYNRGDQDQNRYWDGDADAEHVEILAAPPATASFNGPNANQCVILGQWPHNISSVVYAAWGDQFCKLNVAGDGFDVVDAFTTETPLPTLATNYATTADPSTLHMFIPCQDSYHEWNGTTLVRHALSAVDFCVWEDKLFRLTEAGVILWSNDMGSTWTQVGVMIQGDAPRHLIPFYDRNNVMTVYAISDERTYALDFTDAILFETDLFNPKHPTAGLGVETWRSDLWVAAGLGINHQSNGFINPAGLDRDFGLPKELAGWIVNLEASYNGLFALVRGTTTGTGEVIAETLRLTGQETMRGDAGNTVSSLHYWNGFGWFKYWQGQGIPSTVFVANPSGSYNVWWGCGAKAYKRPLPINYYNPREELPFILAPRSEHVTSRFRWNWVDITKILKTLELKTLNCTPTSNIEVYYRIDDNDAPWSLLANITSPGRQSIRFGTVTWDGYELHYGAPHEWIQLRFVFNVDPATPYVSPSIEWYTLIARKFLRPVRTWSFQIDCSTANKDFTEQEMIKLLERIALTPGAQPFVHQNDYYMVDMTVTKGTDRLGKETSSIRTLTLVETDEVI